MVAFDLLLGTVSLESVLKAALPSELRTSTILVRLAFSLTVLPEAGISKDAVVSGVAGVTVMAKSHFELINGRFLVGYDDEDRDEEEEDESVDVLDVDGPLNRKMHMFAMLNLIMT